jgi:hypothetical protein
MVWVLLGARLPLRDGESAAFSLSDGLNRRIFFDVSGPDR